MKPTRFSSAANKNKLTMKFIVGFVLSCLFAFIGAAGVARISGQETVSGQETGNDKTLLSNPPDSVPGPLEVVEEEEGWLSRDELKTRVEQTLVSPKEARSLHPNNRIWIDRNDQVVVLDGYIAQQNAQLEMFACPIGTKEHESVVSVFAKSQLVHAGLLAIGAKPGAPASFEPFRAARGSTIRVYALWYNAKGERQSTIAQKWVRRMGTKENLKVDWVFAGSREYIDELTKERQYMGDSGELICVANFSTSTMDLVVRSEQANADLVFDVFTSRVPKRYTPVRLVLHLSRDVAFGSEAEHEKETPAFLEEPVPEFVEKYLEEKGPVPKENKGATTPKK